MIFSLIRAEGHSMEPKIKNGSFFMASGVSFWFSKPKIGEIIVFRNKNKLIVKKISKIKNEKFYTEGENNSDSKEFEPLRENEILGKVLWTF